MADLINMKKQVLVKYVLELQDRAKNIPNIEVPEFEGNLKYVGTTKESIIAYAKQLESLVKDNVNLEKVATEDNGDLPFTAMDVYKDGDRTIIVTIKYNPITKACAITNFEKRSHHMAAKVVESNILESSKQEVVNGIPTVHKGYK